MADKILFEKRRLQVPASPIIPYIQGDGIGVDIWKNAQLVFDKALEKAYGGQKKVVWKEVLAGKKAQTRQVTGYRTKRWQRLRIVWWLLRGR